MQIEQIFFKNNLRNFSYILRFEDNTCFSIDPFRSTEILYSLQTQILTGIITTHDHCDHYSGNEELVTKYKCPVMAHTDAVVPFKTRDLTDQEVIYSKNGWTLKTIYTPGHTLSHICVLLEKNNQAYAIFTGDCFFNAGVGNCHNGGNPVILYKTISSIFKNLSDDVLIYPGHDYLQRNLEFTRKYEPTNIAAQNFLTKVKDLNLDEVFFINSMRTEREINTFLRLGSSDLQESLGIKNEEQVFLTLRELRNRW